MPDFFIFELQKAGPFGLPPHARCAAIETRRELRKWRQQQRRRHPSHLETISQRRLMRRLTGE